MPATNHRPHPSPVESYPRLKAQVGSAVPTVTPVSQTTPQATSKPTKRARPSKAKGIVVVGHGEVKAVIYTGPAAQQAVLDKLHELLKASPLGAFAVVTSHSKMLSAKEAAPFLELGVAVIPSLLDTYWKRKSAEFIAEDFVKRTETESLREQAALLLPSA